MNWQSKLKIVLACVAITFSLSPQQLLADVKPLSRPEIENIVRDYLLKNPELLVEMSRLLEAKRRAQTENSFKQSIKNLGPELVSGDGAVVLGNPDGKNVVVEFSDYNCPYCKRMAPIVKKAIKADPELKVVLREFPILGPASQYASMAALAARMQGKYETAHFALISTKGRLTNSRVDQILGSVGLDMAKLKKDMQSPKVKEIVSKNLQFGQQLGINGTPAFIAADKLYPGALSREQFSAMLKTLEEKSPTK